ncbi:hypothetical protein A3H89_04150 [Candidatus Amesbacteria bacterium RIFCSPLOWO2_02_FULL_48_11]|uniref:Uncharacterized protein n=5 Tax=Candidatus Amesiibacteriota TaxID=1752730 RepID=A0A1F4Z8K1_9BACT|nr:MAG: hypothetical protein UX78_C0007G0026 [Candidatus Amesbacteria bacterium GW2011_GWA2_47_11]KKU93229.1 MAG: hypothetical protein UY22_C0021G0025 [Candidatus Amesbacteria bacterium GW2011_GWC1_48_10]KKU99886.1 MAG: hypothetical protein UY33_C0020G0026 [Candidatus Amesbacteria bacterium GW2011_GWA1_48_9]OGC89360.1 MAG: hypothetical protein A2V48_03865 [Candidatus Amesbacteria bacterium RBG_19FT_COMBO_48_16]OGC96671.1 MAG: hypothetical protein A3C34_04260 [Candidatus Amesbacteria bacterium R
MSKAHKILLGVYLACVFVSLIVLAILLLPLPLGWVKLLASLLISPVVLGILFTPFFLVWNDETNLSDRAKLVISLAYTILWISAASLFVYQFINTPKPLLNPVFTSTLTPDEIIISNPASHPFYSCTFFISASGTRQTYQSFFTPFILENCKRQGTAKPFLECQIDNRISLSQLFPKSTTLDKIEAGSEITLNSDIFYAGQTLPSLKFLSSHQPSDIYSLSIVCQQPNGTKISQTLVY